MGLVIGTPKEIRRRAELCPEPGEGRGVAVGIDPSRAALQMALLSPHGDKPRKRRVPLGPGAVKELEELLQEACPEPVEGGDAVIAMEGSHSTGQLFLLQLLERGHDVREVHPFVSKRFREMLTEEHTDEKDAEGLALMALWKRDLPVVRFSQEQATCKRLSRLREQLVQDRTRYLSRLHACLSETYGASYKGLFRHLTAKKALHFFQQYPTINDALAGDPDVPLQVGAEAWERLQQAGCWQEGSYLRCLRAEVRTLATHVLALKDRVREAEREMTKIPTTPQVQLLLTMPQVGPITAMTIAGNTGDVSRFGGDVHRYVAYCGLAPTTHQSGGGEPMTRPRHRYNRHLKRAYLFLAFNQARLNPRAREYYQRKRREGKNHWTALRALARHLCRIVFRMLSRIKPYQEVIRDPQPAP
ncbi:MAG: IS110 family transposase [Dehalococcoidia bacterium]